MLRKRVEALENQRRVNILCPLPSVMIELRRKLWKCIAMVDGVDIDTIDLQPRVARLTEYLRTRADKFLREHHPDIWINGSAKARR